MTTYDDFWGRMGKAAPGMIDLGLGLFGQNQANNEAQQRLRAAQGPVFQSAMQTAGMDPTAAASTRFNQQHGLLAGVDAKSEADLMRMLHAKGMLGAATYNPGVEGITPNGTAMNPKLAAYYAARNARDAKMAADSLDAGDRMVSGALDRAGRAQDIGLQAQRQLPSRAAQNMNLLKGATSILKDTGMLQSGLDWLKDSIFGGGNDLGFDVGFGDYWN